MCHWGPSFFDECWKVEENLYDKLNKGAEEIERNEVSPECNCMGPGTCQLYHSSIYACLSVSTELGRP